jgi:hypothetical protein
VGCLWRGDERGWTGEGEIWRLGGKRCHSNELRQEPVTLPLCLQDRPYILTLFFPFLLPLFNLSSSHGPLTASGPSERLADTPLRPTSPTSSSPSTPSGTSGSTPPTPSPPTAARTGSR